MRLSRSRAASGRQGDDRLPPSCNARPFELFEDGLEESAVIQDRLRANYDLQASARPPRRRERRRNRRGGTPYAGLKSEAASHGQGVCGDVLAERMRAAIASVILIVGCSRRSNIQQSDLNCSMGPHFGLPGFWVSATASVAARGDAQAFDRCGELSAELFGGFEGMCLKVESVGGGRDDFAGPLQGRLCGRIPTGTGGTVACRLAQNRCIETQCLGIRCSQALTFLLVLPSRERLPAGILDAAGDQQVLRSPKCQRAE